MIILKNPLPFFEDFSKITLSLRSPLGHLNFPLPAVLSGGAQNCALPGYQSEEIFHSPKWGMKYFINTCLQSHICAE